jgi:hypothetical protein
MIVKREPNRDFALADTRGLIEELQDVQAAAIQLCMRNLNTDEIPLGLKQFG